MRLTNLFTKTSKTVPADETSKNAQLLIRAGFVHKTMSGVYSYLPLGLRVINKIENIVRRNLNGIGAQEVLMNALHPKVWWETTNRWEGVDILFKLKSQTDAEYALACSHEEQVTPIVKTFIQSWKDLPEYTEGGDLPLATYQIQTKFRDELRSKSGLLRGREFRMKDMYDFHRTQESADKYYELVKKTYHKIYEDLGLQAYAVHASGGIFTQNDSHEFQVVCDAGEDKIFLDEDADAVYNEEIAPSRVGQDNEYEEPKKREDVLAEGVVGVQALLKHLGIDIVHSTKTLFYEADGKLIAVCVRSDYNVNEEKLMKVGDFKSLAVASEDLVKQVTSAEIGYAGIINLPADTQLILDDSLEGLCNFETGTNKTGYHSINVNFEVDLKKPDVFYDIKVVKEGDKNPATGTVYETHKVAEVGNIFKLGDKYTKAFDLTVLDSDNKPQLPIMNCYGIGTSRCMGVIAEIYSDEAGLKWPTSVAPYQFHLITNINDKDDAEINNRVKTIAEAIYSGQTPVTSGLADEVLFDDRSGISIGQKLADAELIGCPTIVLVTKRSLENGGVEIKDRATGESRIVDLD